MGSVVHQLRQLRSWTLEKASERMGLDFRHLQQIEAGTVNVTLATILRIADAFDVSPFLILPGPKDGGPKVAPTPTRYTKLKLGPAAGRVIRVPAIREAGPRVRAAERPNLRDFYYENPIPENAAWPQMAKRVGRSIARFRNLQRPEPMTQVDLAEKLTVSVKYVQAVEGGKANLTIKSLTAFADALGAHVYELFMIIAPPIR